MPKMNTSAVADNITANTNPDAAQQRAENLAVLGAKNVLELCVGPSLKILKKFYDQQKINVVGNDIEERWKTYWPQGNWIIGDALTIPYSNFDTVVFAPPLSKGCTGTRADSLSIDKVFPRYNDFIARASKEKSVKNFVLVLPARSIATSNDRAQLFQLLNTVAENGFDADLFPLRTKKRSITKYVDCYLQRRV